MVLDRARSLSDFSEANGSVGSGGGYRVEYGNEGGGLRLILVSRWEGGTVVAILYDEGASVLDLRVVVGTVRRGGGDGRERRGGGEYLKAGMRLRCLFHAIAANNTFNIKY